MKNRLPESAAHLPWTCVLFLLTTLAIELHSLTLSAGVVDGPPCLWDVDSYPDPQVDHDACHRSHPSFICDNDEVLAQDEVDNLQHMIELLHNKTPCHCPNCPSGRGAINVGVAIVRDMCQPQNETLEDVGRSFASQLRSRWKLGPCDNDILILVTKSGREAYMDVGQNASDILSRDVVDSIFNETRGHFRSASYYQGLESMIQSYYDSVRTVQSSPEEDNDDGGEQPIYNSMVVIVGLSAVSVVLLIIIVTAIVYARWKHSKGDDSDDPPPGADSEKGMMGWRAEGARDVASATRYEPCQVDDENDSDSDDEDATMKLNESEGVERILYHPSRQLVQGLGGRRRQLSAVVEVSETEEEDSETVGLNTEDAEKVR